MTAQTQTKYFQFSQNNSGGSFEIDDARGLGPRVWVEATSSDDADNRALGIGIYFNGCEDGQDCECCGDRWSTSYGDGHSTPELNQEYDFNWHDTVYVHDIDGTIRRIKKSQAAA